MSATAGFIVQLDKLTRNTPCRFCNVRRKEAVAHKIAYLLHGFIDDFLEAFVIAELRNECVRVDMDRDAAIGELESVDFTILLGKESERPKGKLLVNQEDIAKKWNRRGVGDGG